MSRRNLANYLDVIDEDDYRLSDEQVRDAEELAAMRNSVKLPSSTFYCSDPDDGNRIGAYGEIGFEGRYGLIVVKKVLPWGDGGIDFTFYRNNGKHKYTIDVKTSRDPWSLKVKEQNIDRCADVLVQCRFHDERWVRFLGWQTKTWMKKHAELRAIKGTPNYCCPIKDLRPMCELTPFIEGRDK